MKWYQFKKENIPNYLTCLRILLTPIIIVLLLVPTTNIAYKLNIWSNYVISVSTFTLVASILFVIASITDFIDGWLARKYQWISNFGKFWDPLADKVLTNSVLFCLASKNQDLLPIWIPIIFLVRDIIVDGFRLNLNSKNIVLSANIYGKCKTFTLMFAIIYLMFFGSSVLLVGPLYYWLIQNFLIYVATILCIVSGIIYIFPSLKKTKNNNI